MKYLCFCAAAPQCACDYFRLLSVICNIPTDMLVAYLTGVGISHRREWYGVQDKVAQAAADEALALALSEAHHHEAQAMAYKVTFYYL